MSLILGTSGIISVLTGFIGGLLYPMFSIIFLLIQAVQNFFFVFAGIGSASFNGEPINSGLTGEETDQGLIYYLMQNDLVVNMLFSIMMLALFLIIIFTVMAFIKNAYAAKPKGWKEIVGSAIKGLANFVFLPVCCLLGVWLGNILLKAINGATSGGGAYYMDRKLFIAAAYNSNEFRNGDENAVADPSKVQELRDFINTFGSTKELFGATKDENGKLQDIENLPDGKTNAYYADLVDYIYANSKVSIYEWGMVEKWYSLFEINYLVLIVGGVFMLYVLGSLTFAMIRRMFYILVLFIISPGVCAMYPLDDGKAVGSWKSEFIKQVLSAYGAVAGMNIFFSLMPLIDKIQLSWWAFGINEIIQIFIMVCGLLIVKDLIGLLSGFVGGEDAYSKGSALMKSASKEVVGRGKKAIGGVGGAFVRAGSAAVAADKGDRFKSFASSIGKSTWGGIKSGAKSAAKTLTGGAFDYDEIKKGVDNAKKEGAAEIGKMKSASKLFGELSTGRTDHDTAKTAFAAATTDSATLDALKDLKASRTLADNAFQNMPQDIKGELYSDVGKSRGMTGQQISEDLKTADGIEDSLMKLLGAKEKYETMDSNLVRTATTTGYGGLAALFGTTATNLSSLGYSTAQLVDMARNNSTIDSSSLPVNQKMAADKFNEYVEKLNKKKTDKESSLKDLQDVLKSASGNIRDAGGNIVTISDADISSITASNAATNTTIRALIDVAEQIRKDVYDSKKVSATTNILKTADNIDKKSKSSK